MVKSMTGYGRGQSYCCGKEVTVDMRSVNHRFLEIAIKLPRQYTPFEEKIKNLIKERVSRGRIDVFINIEETGENQRHVKVDKELAIAYHKSLKELGEIVQIPQNISLFEISQLPDVVKVEEKEIDLESFWEVVKEATLAALDGLVTMRQVEGGQLANDLMERQGELWLLVETIQMRSEDMTDIYRLRIQERIQELLAEIPVDNQRLAMEVAFLAERSAITEELVRLRSHLDQLAETLQSTEPVGRKLDFLVQELHREINTIGSKANDLEISQKVVEMKSQLEKIREQVQNLE